MKDDDGARKNLLFHRLVYSVHNNLDYGFSGVCCHYNDDKTNNNIGNLYLGDGKSNSNDRWLSAGLARAYKDGNILEFLENNGYD